MTNVPFVAAAAAVLLSAAGTVANPPARTKLLASGLTSPTCMASTAADPQRLYVCQREGAIVVIDKTTGVRQSEAFLDVSPLVDVNSDNGLLGMAFDPNYMVNGYFYINYNTTGGDIVLERYHVAPGATVAEAGSGYTIWRYPRPLGHNGGWIGFSPINGLLYITSGDGDLGGTFDGQNRAQTITNQKMGKIHRIDPSSDDFPADPTRNYRIPPSNPFVGEVGDDEIWAIGVRNPWRGSFDRLTGDFYFGDVGMDVREEVSVLPASSAGGRNFGWPCLEGTSCTPSTACICADAALTPPIYEYAHVFGVGGFSVTGGYVYRGAAIPALNGLYFCADFLQPKIWSFRPPAGGSGAITEFVDRSVEFTPLGSTSPLRFVATFGEDSAGELYIVTLTTGRIYKIIPFPCRPEIDAHPMDQSKSVNSTVTLSVLGIGADPMTIQWFKGGVPVVNDARISGATAATLTITSALVADSGSYSAQLTSPCGMTPSTAANVVVFTCRSADVNNSGNLTVQDIFDFLFLFFSFSLEADFDNSGSVSVQDIFDFLFSYFSGCV